MNSREKYEKNYESILEESKNHDLFKLLLMSKIYKAPTYLDMDKDNIKTLKKCFQLIKDEQSINNVCNAIKKLSEIDGIRIPTASAFLHFITEGKIPIIDKYAYATFLKENKKMKNEEIKEVVDKSNFKINLYDYEEYYKFFRKKYSRMKPKEINFDLMEKGKAILNGK